MKMFNGKQFKATKTTDLAPGLHRLEPVLTRQKSFYGKAIVWTCEKGVILCSYETDVCCITPNGHILLNGTYSNTTRRHIADFLYQYKHLYNMHPEYKGMTYDKASLEKLVNPFCVF